VIRTSKDGKERWIRVRVPVDEGLKYKVGKFEIVSTALKADGLRPLFKIQEGDTYSSDKFRKGLEKVKEAYGQYGFWQWAPDAVLQPRGLDAMGQPIGSETPEPIIDVTLNMDEGKQFFVNRITFLGNTTTHDAVIRREMRVLEGGIYNAEALKESVRRLNQLGYFKPFEGKEGEMDVVQSPGTDDHVDVKLKFQEQNRNQTFLMFRRLKIDLRIL
jgi:outer membrane protein insertion porin family